jgi:predicted enzyme related to lactoylglutathione lyase
MLAAHRVVWWEIETPDPAAAQRFYGELFGWSFRREFDGPGSQLHRDYWIVERDGEGIGGLQAALADSPTPQAGARLYVQVGDLEATIARAVELGATVERERTYLGSDDFWFANVRDPQGVSLGLWTPNQPA